jgi:phosphoglycolate phosphatase-like HAD superfamily hydrolase
VPGIHLGLLTGNLEKVGWWKLGQAGIEGLFKFGLFSDQAQSRMEIAKNAITLANIYFKTDFQPENTYVLGDTVYDIRCGKSISAKTIGIENPRLHNFQALSDEKADIVVRSLDEDKVYNYITS